MTETDFIPLSSTGVYMIANLLNGKTYIGSAARSFRSRFNGHRGDLRLGKHHSRHLQMSWSKYGEDAFAFVPLVATHPGDAVRMEQLFIDAWRPAYNRSPTAGSVLGLKHPPEANAKKSAMLKEKMNRPEEVERQRAIALVIHNRPEVKAKKREAMGEILAQPGWLDARNAAIKRTSNLPEVRLRKGAAAKAMHARPEVKAKLREALRRVGQRPDVMLARSIGIKATKRAKSKVTLSVALEILDALAQGESRRSVSERTSIDSNAIARIAQGKHWIFEDNAL